MYKLTNYAQICLLYKIMHKLCTNYQKLYRNHADIMQIMRILCKLCKYYVEIMQNLKFKLCRFYADFRWCRFYNAYDAKHMQKLCNKIMQNNANLKLGRDYAKSMPVQNMHHEVRSESSSSVIMNFKLIISLRLRLPGVQNCKLLLVRVLVRVRGGDGVWW